MTTPVRVRFAPSPTGYLHVGGARTALFNYLFAKKHNGTFILRIEDTDRSRYQEGALVEIFESLRWMGLTWDEGPEYGGNFGPYFQSERLELYAREVARLIENGAAYRCFCTPERLAALRAEQESKKLPQVSGYDKHCRTLSPEEEKQLLAQGKPFVIRLKIPADRKIVFNDAIRGSIEYASNDLDDLVLLKTDGFPTYHLANVIDDHHMQISHVMRGDEWISSTPRHVLLYEAFGWTPPVFAHLPIILSPDGGKLSKRKGAASVMDYKRAGYLPEALFNFLALLGWSPGDDKEKLSTNEMCELFSLERVSAKGAVLDEKKLEWMNGLYMQECDNRTLFDQVKQLWAQKGIIVEELQALTVIDMMKGRSKKTIELADNSVYFFRDPDTFEEKAVKKYFTSDSMTHLKNLAGLLNESVAFDKISLEALFHGYAQKQNLGLGNIVHPVRLSISGVSFGPGLFELMEMLGKEPVVRRINAVINKK
jgi:glutamyl-tRNA synthetase